MKKKSSKERIQSGLNETGEYYERESRKRESMGYGAYYRNKINNERARADKKQRTRRY